MGGDGTAEGGWMYVFRKKSKMNLERQNFTENIGTASTTSSVIPVAQSIQDTNLQIAPTNSTGAPASAPTNNSNNNNNSNNAETQQKQQHISDANSETKIEIDNSKLTPPVLKEDSVGTQHTIQSNDTK